MTPYQRGARLEYRARDVLRQQGYVVIRSAGSHGPADLIALNKQEVLLVQVKKAGQPVRLALHQLASLRTPLHTRKQVWEYQPAHGRTPARWHIIDAPRRKTRCLTT